MRLGHAGITRRELLDDPLEDLGRVLPPSVPKRSDGVVPQAIELVRIHVLRHRRRRQLGALLATAAAARQQRDQKEPSRSPPHGVLLTALSAAPPGSPAAPSARSRSAAIRARESARLVRASTTD